MKSLLLGSKCPHWGRQVGLVYRGDFNCLQEVCLGSWSLLLIPMERINIFIVGLGNVLPQIFWK